MALKTEGRETKSYLIIFHVIQKRSSIRFMI